MSTFRRITKLKVNIATGETVLSYDDATTRYTVNRNCGFCAAESWTSFVASTAQASTTEMDSATSLKEADANRVTESKTEPQATGEQPTKLAQTFNDGAETNSSSCLDMCSTTYTSKMSVALLATAKLGNLQQSTSDFTELEHDVDTACSTASSQDNLDLPAVHMSEADLLQSAQSYASIGLPLAELLPVTPTSSWALIKSVMPELLKTDVLAEEAACAKQLPNAYQPRRFVTWHLSTCSFKDDIRLPICSCLKIKTCLSQLSNNLDSFLQMPSVHSQAEDYGGCLAQFFQALLDLRTHMQQLHQLLLQHVLCNK